MAGSKRSKRVDSSQFVPVRRVEKVEMLSKAFDFDPDFDSLPKASEGRERGTAAHAPTLRAPVGAAKQNATGVAISKWKRYGTTNEFEIGRAHV